MFAEELTDFAIHAGLFGCGRLNGGGLSNKIFTEELTYSLS